MLGESVAVSGVNLQNRRGSVEAGGYVAVVESADGDCYSAAPMCTAHTGEACVLWHCVWHGMVDVYGG